MTQPTKTRLIPREGLKLRDPRTGKPIPPEGIVVNGPLGAFWHRRVTEGDVVKAEA
jgi:hypothetical protein